MVSMLALNSYKPSLNPAECSVLYSVKLFEKTKISTNEAGYGPLKKT